MQPLFSKFSVFSYLAIIVGLLAIHFWFKSVPNRTVLPRASAEVRFTPVEFDPSGFAPLRLAGAWQVEVGDPRFGGVSALALDGENLLALSDSGSVLWLPKPNTAGRAILRDLPAGPGTASFKYNRDSEALARDPEGKGWWVAFERWNQLWLYDQTFSKAISRRDFGVDRWRQNKGVEGMVAADGKLLLFPEAGDEWLEVKPSTVSQGQLDGIPGSISDAVMLADGRLLLVSRELTSAGLGKRLWLVERGNKGRLTARPLAVLPLAATDNVEAIAAEPRNPGGTRLWLMTDNDFRPRQRTLLLALDLP